MHMNSVAGARHRIAQTMRVRPMGAKSDRGVPPTGLMNRHQIDDERAIAMCDALIDLLSETLDVPSTLLRSTSRCSASVARARQTGMYLAHTGLGLTMAQVAAGFSRNKSTVVHACHTIEDLRDDEVFDAFIARQERIIGIVRGGHLDANPKTN